MYINHLKSGSWVLDHGHVDIIDGCIWQRCQMSSSADGWWLVEFTCVDATNLQPKCNSHAHLSFISTMKACVRNMCWCHYPWSRALQLSGCSALHCHALPNLGKRWGTWLQKSQALDIQNPMKVVSCSTLRGCKKRESVIFNNSDHHVFMWYIVHVDTYTLLFSPAKLCASTKLGNRAHRTVQHDPACKGENPPPTPPPPN